MRVGPSLHDPQTHIIEQSPERSSTRHHIIHEGEDYRGPSVHPSHIVIHSDTQRPPSREGEHYHGSSVHPSYDPSHVVIHSDRPHSPRHDYPEGSTSPQVIRVVPTHGSLRASSPTIVGVPSGFHPHTEDMRPDIRHTPRYESLVHYDPYCSDFELF